MQGATDFFIVLPYLAPFLTMTYRVLYEKEKKITEGFKMMGMSQTSYYLSWIYYYAKIYALIAVLISTILKLGIFVLSDWLLIWFLFFLFGLVLIG